jgi:hypothetical protein
MVVFDTSTLLLALDPNTRPPIDPGTNKPVDQCKARVELLLANLQKAKTPILIPTPVLAEFLVKAGPEKHQMIDRFTNSRNFEIGPFDVKAAVELAELLGDPDLLKKPRDEKTTKAKLKFDRQIVAIAKTRGATPARRPPWATPARRPPRATPARRPAIRTDLPALLESMAA